ncbi:iron-containing alcohol dehydrogenase family protein [Pectobacterium parmentieri]|uniref:iron-containing alcohol dehydrogenase family protein n=1 Tax=Pectobacterium parmentieri TaxID=1905730 RepID=UPI000EB141F9|nr:iron-containing alcohol dehydrogenase family protein [Pectobacterium parmentieri]AYH03295.1 oxidoreductase [Pectobacterium parmentieri]AYH29554.1 oxidoreductase [Pectobacterium parmentieri]AYH33972.1 oxidoreductase [Pectobacterium parmentieri]MBI0517020.1 iron-containing alcohol dehydrogenase family protein [Pectobacterium parmentieri]
MLSIKSPLAYHHQADLCRHIGELIRSFSQNIAILTSPRAWQAVENEVTGSLKDSGIAFDVHFLTGECTRESVEYHREKIARNNIQFVVGIGGGRVLDCAKAVADGLENGQVATLPTIAATCAAWSPISILYNDHGGHQGTVVLKRMPVLVMVDSSVIARSDARYLKAGIVDALAKWYEFQPYLISCGDSLALSLKIQAATFARDIFEQWGEQAIRDNKNQEVTPALQKVIDAAIAGAGLANSMRDENPAPGVAHAIHNRLTYIPELHDWLHGEKVGFGLLVQSLLAHDSECVDDDLLEQLSRYDMSLSLPIAGDQYEEAVKHIVTHFKFPTDSAALLPFSLSPDALSRALLAVENMHR